MNNPSDMSREQLLEELSRARTRRAELEARQAARNREQSVVGRREERYRTLIHESRDAFYVTARDGRIIEFNPAATALFGYTMDELSAMTVQQMYVDPDDRIGFQQEIERFGFVRDYELKLRRKDGSHIDCLLTSNLRRSSDGTVVGYQGSIRDVTARRRAERALRESEDRYRIISELTSDFAYGFRVELGRDLSCEWVTGALVDLTGYTQAELKVLGGWSALVYPDDIHIPESQLENLLANEISVVEYRMLAKGGEVRWMRDYARPVWDPAAGRVTHIYGAVQDVTDRRRAEKVQSVLLGISQAAGESRTLEELSEVIRVQLGRLIDTSNFYVALYDEENDWYKLPYAVDEQDTTDPDVPERLQGSLTDYVRRTGRPLFVTEEIHQELMDRGEAQLVGAPSILWLGVPLKTADKVIGVVAVQSYSEDTKYTEADLELMTFVSGNIAVAIERKWAEEERERLESQIRHAQKLESLGVLAGGIAHDFNNLLTGILGNADLALMSVAPDSPEVGCLKGIKTTAERAAELCQQMLAYSGKGSFVVAPIDLNKMVEEMGQLLEISISKKAFLSYDLAQDLPTVVADTTQIRQVLMNLITNASDAIGERDGVITISTRVAECDRAYLAESKMLGELPEGTYVRVDVRDTGSGMDEDTVHKVFDPFFTTKFTGRGLGLAAVLGIVRGHGGAVRVNSELGKGTVFTVLLPASCGLTDTCEETPMGDHEWYETGKVLLVDDEACVRDVGSRMLKRAGFDVVTADDGLKAIEFFRDHSDEVGCVLLDLTMPRMDGEEAYREMRRIRSDVRVVLSTGYSKQEIASRFDGEGIAGFVQKPYVAARLVAEIKAAMSGSEKRPDAPE